MKQQYVDYLFAKGVLVSEDWAEENVFASLCLLGQRFGIRIDAGRQLASKSMIPVAARGLGEMVPDAFYRGFPQSVRAMAPSALLFDQIVHYLTTYGLGCFDEPGHSLLEKNLERTLFRESCTPKVFRAVTTEDAMKLLRGYVNDMLKSTRPLADDQYELVRSFVAEEQHTVRCVGCKDTVIRLLLDTRDISLARLLALPDVIRLVEQLQYQVYHSKNIRKLNLCNQDRRLITRVLDRLLDDPNCDVITCFEKKQLWNGLLHHIHYKPRCRAGEEFVSGIRGDKNLSVYAGYEAFLAAGDPVGAARLLCEKKSVATMLRRLDHLLALCNSQEQVDALLGLIHTDNKIVLGQMLMFYANYKVHEPRTFRFTRFGLMKLHNERKSQAHFRRQPNASVREAAFRSLRAALADACRGQLKRVYADEAMKSIAVSMNAVIGSSGYGTLPTGSRMAIPTDKIIRNFVYWHRVHDVDMSCHIYPNDIYNDSHFYFGNMSRKQSAAICFSGDQTSGYNGGSEYFDVNPEAFRRMYPNAEYLVFYANVFCGGNFSTFPCTAGFMLRDAMDSGEIYEPKTVTTAFAINAASTEACLFALDLKANQMVWLNLDIDSSNQVGGHQGLDFLSGILNSTSVLNLYDLACMMATEVVDDPAQADIVFSDRDLALPEGVRQVRSTDTEYILALLNT